MQVATTVQFYLVESTSIAAIGYDPNARFLEVRFHSGSLYRYEHVSIATWLEFSAAPSKGRYFNEAVRNEFASVRLE